MWRRLLATALLALGTAARAAEPLGVTTILEGEALLLRGSEAFALAEGVRLAAGDIVATSGQSRLVRLELGSGAIVDLGPASRLQLAPRLAGDRRRRAAPLYLLQGWAKLGSAKGALAAAPLLATPSLDLSGLRASVVLAIEGDASFVFAESGDQVLAERRGGRSAAPLTLRSGQFYTRRGDEKAEIVARPSPAFLQRVPRPFLDTLPPLAQRFKGTDVAPKPLGPVAWDDAQPWVDAERDLRRGFVSRWRSRSRDAEFRRGLLGNERAHPEWDPVLHPEKYLPKPASAPGWGPVSDRNAASAPNR